jgi:hypothetical protein
MKRRLLPHMIEGKKLYSVDEAVVLLGMCRDKVYDLLLRPERETHKPALYSVKVGRLRKIPAPAMERFLARLMEGA